jgi:putative PIN family toxin of toxin-antitoxin system
MKPKIVIDTNVIIAALKSSRGASNKLFHLFGAQKFIHSISVALVLEYEDVINRLFPDFSKKKINDLLDYICANSLNARIYYLWRPHLKDPGDDMILELAVASSSEFIVTYNLKDFKGAKHFNIKVVTPKELLLLMGELS